MPERLAFCPACGQDTQIKPPTVREFAQQFGGSYIAVEGALWRSLKLLFFKPGGLTVEYLEGRRRRYVLPLRLYLTVSVIALLLLRTVASVGMGGLEKAADGAKPIKGVTMSLGIGKAGVREGTFFCEDLPAWICARLAKRIHVEPRQVVEDLRRAGERVVSNAGIGMFIVLPSFAFWLWLVYRNRRLRYTEHLVFALHVHAFWFAMLSLTLVDWTVLTTLAAVAVPLYTLLAMHRVYGGRWWPTLLRAGTISALYLFALLPTMVALWIWAILF